MTGTVTGLLDELDLRVFGNGAGVVRVGRTPSRRILFSDRHLVPPCDSRSYTSLPQLGQPLKRMSVDSLYVVRRYTIRVWPSNDYSPVSVTSFAHRRPASPPHASQATRPADG